MAERRMYVTVAFDEGKPLTEQVPHVMGPFSTPTRADKAGERSWGEAEGVRWIRVPLFAYFDAKEQRISLPYDRLLDPTLRKRCLACKQTIKQEVADDTAA